jgi:hypothetical protein
MIPISEKSSRGALVDWVPEGHDRKYTEPAAMSIRIAATSVGLAYIDARGPPRIGSFSSLDHTGQLTLPIG